MIYSLTDNMGVLGFDMELQTTRLAFLSATFSIVFVVVVILFLNVRLKTLAAKQEKVQSVVKMSTI